MSYDILSPTVFLFCRIEQEIFKDQQGATQPDTSTPFLSKSDAVKRLLRYHTLNEPVLSEKDLEKADEIFEATSQHLLDKKSQMLNKYRYLLWMDSMVSLSQFYSSYLFSLNSNVRSGILKKKKSVKENL